MKFVLVLWSVSLPAALPTVGGGIVPEYFDSLAKCEEAFVEWVDRDGKRGECVALGTEAPEGRALAKWDAVHSKVEVTELAEPAALPP